MALRSWGQCQEIHASTIILSYKLIIFASIFTFVSQASGTSENNLLAEDASSTSSYYLFSQETSNWFYCPKGWTLFKNHCYSLTEAKLTWTQSEAYCNSKGGNLVSITSQTENNFINRFLHQINPQQDDLWIGLVHHINHTFHWSTGQTAVEQDGFWAVNGLDSYYASPHSKLCCYMRSPDPVYQDLRWVLTSSCEELHASLCMLQPCEEHAVLCEDGARCVNRAWLCDGHLDCADGSDEANCDDGSSLSTTSDSTHCGTMMKGISGSLLSPNYPGHYPSFCNCIWKIEVAPSKVIELRIEKLAIEEKYDSLQIFDGLEMSEQSLLEYFDGNVTQVKVTSTNSFVYLKFKSDHSIEASGFNITWQAVEPHGAGCGGVIPATSQVQHLLFPTSHSRVLKQRHCEWLISASSSTVVNILINPNMQLKGEDVIRIYDGPNSSYTVITEINSTHCILAPDESQLTDPLGLTSGNIPSVIVSSSPYFFIYANLGSRNLVHILSYSQGCDVLIYSESSIIISPGYANSQYVNNLQCSWTVQKTVQSKALTVVFLPDFLTEAFSDYVHVKNTSCIMASISGSYPQYQSVNSIYHDFSIEFVSDSTVNRGRWAAVVSEDCDVMSMLPPLSISSTENHFGTVVQFSCPQDFHLIGSSTAVCGLNGQWMMSEEPACKKIDCGPAPFIDKGYLVNITGTQIGSLAKYQCFHGYRMVDSEVAECGKGSWQNVPDCEVITCPKEPPPLHGLALAEYITFGYVREYFCEEGYQMSGSKFSHCAVNGQWSSPLPMCQAPNCPGIINLPHGRVNASNEPIYVGESVQITCDSGYTPSGPNVLTCLASLQYDLPVPLCTDIDECSVKTHTCGRHVCQNILGDYACFCQLGYQHLKGSTKLCIDINECDIENGGCSDLCSNTDGSYICQCSDHSIPYQGPGDKRFNLVLKPNQTCIETCAPLLLGDGMNVMYSERPLYNNVYLVGTAATVQCSPGMFPDLTTINCSAMNTWTPKVPICQRPACEKPAPPLNGYVYYSSLSVGSHVKYSCRNGYYLTLPYERYCVKNATLGRYMWSGPQPQCRYVQCPTPVTPENGTVNFTTKYYNSVAIYRCLCGFKLIGQSVARCNGDGQWGVPAPICQIQYCKNPHDLTNATIVTYQQGFPVGSSVTFRCDKPGFSLSEGDTITCQKLNVSKESVLRPSLVLSLQVDLVSTSQAYTIPTCLDACADTVRKLIMLDLKRLLDVALEQNVLIEFTSASTFSIDKMSVVVKVTVFSDNVSKVCRHRRSLRDAVRDINPESFNQELTSCSVSCPPLGVKSGSAINITDAWTCMSGLKFNNETCLGHVLPACLEECVGHEVVLTNWDRPDLTATTEQIELITSTHFSFTSESTVGSTVRTLSTDQSLSTSEPAFDFTQEIIPLGEATTQPLVPESRITELGTEETDQPPTTQSNTISTDFKPTLATYPMESGSTQSQTPSSVTDKTKPKTERPDAERLPGNSFTDEPRGEKSKGRVDSDKEKSSVPSNASSSSNITSCTNILLHNYRKENKSKGKATGEKDNSIPDQLNDTDCMNLENKDTLKEQEQHVTVLGAAPPFFSIVVTDSMVGDFSNISCINISHKSINTKVNEILRDFSSQMGQDWCQNSNSTLELTAGNIRFKGLKASIYINFSIVYSTSNKASIEQCARQFQEFIRDKLPGKFEKVRSEVTGFGCESVDYTGSESNFTAAGWTCPNGYILDESNFQCTQKSMQATSRPTRFTTGPRLKKNFRANFTVAHHSNSGCNVEYMKSINTLLNVYIQELFRNVSGVNISLNKLITPTFVDNMILVHGSVNFIPLQDAVNTSFLIDLAALITHHSNNSLNQSNAGNTIDVPRCSQISLKGLWAQTNNWTYYCDSGYNLDEFNLKCLHGNLPLLVSNISLTVQGRFTGEICERTVSTSAWTLYQAAVREIQQNITQRQICNEFKHVIILLNQDPYIKMLVGKAQISMPVKLISLQGSKSDCENCANQVFHQFRSALVTPASKMVQNISKICRFNVPVPEKFSLSISRWKCFQDHQYSPVLHSCEQPSQSDQDRETGQKSKVRHKRDIQESVMWSSPPPQCIDIRAPQFQNCPGPPRVITLNNFLTRQVLSLPDVSDNSGHVPTMTYTPSFFTISTPFPRELQLVIKATDGAGLTATCNVDFIVEDDIPPVLDCPDVVTISEQFHGNYRLKHSQLNITCSDNSGIVSLTTVPPAGYEIPTKQNVTITAIATDGSGNTQTCQFRLNVTPQGCYSELLVTYYGVKKNCTSYGNDNESLICTITCPPYTIPLQTLICRDGMWNGTSMACGFEVCPKGYYLTSGLCMECDVGQYQDRENSTVCLSCPTGQSTPSIRSTSIQDCLEMCGQNEFSTTGLKPCQPCPNGFHQPHRGSKFCQVCTNNEKYCQGNCQPGNYSVARLSSCKPCPLNYYNKFYNRDNCIACPANQITQNVGSKNTSFCIPDDCHSGSYRHSCTCFSNQTDFWCICNGSICSLENDPCYSQPCQNNGTCLTKGSNWSCQCPLGFTGPICAIKVNLSQPRACNYGNCDPTECKMDCYNGGTCVNNGPASRCSCVDGFSGSQCEYNINDCSMNYCLNGGICHDGINSFFCTCQEGFTGNLCQTDLDDCASLPCQNNGLCQDFVNGFSCHCQTGYCGDLCEETIDPCDSQPCENEGTCEALSNSPLEFYCECTEGYTGRTCDVVTSYCDSMPCNVNGTLSCNEEDNMCHCLPNWHGDLCYDYWDACRDNPCGGDICVLDPSDPTQHLCLCPLYVSSNTCSVMIDLCSSSPCQNSGHCTSTGSTYICQCSQGFTGSNCEANIDECTSQPCQHNGSCKDGINQVFCQCPLGFAGEFCQIDIDECLNLPCLNAGTCRQLVGDYLCTCTEGFTGKNCELKMNPCHNQPCQNNGFCQEEGSGFVCVCLPGYFGDLCQFYSEECLNTSKCLNGAKCYRHNSEDVCKCTPYFVGPDCGKEQTSDYDLYFSGNQHAAVSIPPFNVSALNELSLCLWVNLVSESTYLSLETPHLLILSLRSSNGPASIVMNSSVQLQTNDGLWHHICFTLTSSFWLIYLDGQKLSQWENNHWPINDSLKLTFGQKPGRMDEEWVKGHLSKLNIYSSALNESQVLNMSKGCQQTEPGDVFNWVVTQSYIQNDVDILLPSQCDRRICRSLVCSPTPTEVTDRTPPVVVTCPQDQIETSLKSPVAVSWTEPSFTDNVAVVRLKQTYRSGQSFDYGSYRIIYLAYDSQNNSAECSFDLFVRKTQCVDLSPPQSGSRICLDWSHGRYCIPSCMAKYNFVTPTARFYRCGQEGVWDPATVFPACSRYTVANYTISGNIMFEGSACSENQKQELKAKLTSITSKVCYSDSYSCGENLLVDCNYVDRKKRQADESVGHYNVSIDITVVPNLNKDLGTFLVNVIPEKIVQGFKNDPEMNFTMTSVQFETSQQCQTGQMLQNGSCVDCLTGYYVGSDNVCRPCAKGWYNDKPLQTICLQCPDGLTTAKVGSSHFSQCVSTCKVGHFYNESTSTCELCPLAHFQENTGQWDCLKCPPGLTTDHKGAKSAADCLNLCTAGHEVGQDGKCQLCPEGTYREDKSPSPYCIPCALEWSTEGLGSPSEIQCTVAKCKRGYYKNLQDQTCSPCPIGTFQPLSGAKSCLPCGFGLTTEKEGADSKELCVKGKINEYTCEKVCKNRNSCGTGDGLTGCSCDTVQCKKTSKEDNLNETLLIVSISLTVVAFGVLSVVISVCVYRKNEELKLKMEVRMYRDDNEPDSFTNEAFDRQSCSEVIHSSAHMPIRLATRWHSNYLMSHHESMTDIESTDF